MLPTALRVNQTVRQSELAQVAERLLGQSFASPRQAAEALLQQVQSLCGEIGIPTRLRDIGVRREQIGDLVAASHGNSLSGNPRDLSDDELREVLASLW